MKRIFKAAITIVGAVMAVAFAIDAHAAAVVASSVIQHGDIMGALGSHAWALAGVGSVAATGAMGRKNAGGAGSGDEISDLVKTELKRIGDTVGEKQNAFQARLQELEQKVARRGGIDPAGVSTFTNGSLAEAMKSEDMVAAFKERNIKELRINVANFGRKATVISDGATPSITPFAQTAPGIMAPLLEQPTLEDLLPHSPMTTGVIEWLREVAGADVTAAAQAAQGELKKQGAMSFDQASSKAATAAIWMKFSNQVLDDTAGLAAYVEQRLRYGLDMGVEALLLNGTGANGQNEGMLLPANHTALVTTGLATTGVTMFDYIRRAKKQVRLAQGRAGALLIHPGDAELMDTAKDSEGRYLTGGPANSTGGVWGLTPIETTEIEEGTFVVADFQRAAVFYDRQDATIGLGYTDDDMIRNLVTVLLERRFAVAWNRPALIVVGEFATAA